MASPQSTDSSGDNSHADSEDATLQHDVIEFLASTNTSMDQIKSNLLAVLESVKNEMRSQQDAMRAITDQATAAEERLTRIEELHRGIRDEYDTFVREETRLAKKRDQEIRWLRSENRVLSGRLQVAEKLIHESAKAKFSNLGEE